MKKRIPEKMKEKVKNQNQFENEIGRLSE